MRVLLSSLAIILITGSALAQEATPPPADAAAPAAAAPASEAQPAPPPPPSGPRNPSPSGAIVVIATSMGDITVQLDEQRAPKAAANFLRYVRAGHYNGTVIYRVAPGFVIQMGSWDALGRGRGVQPPVPLETANGLSNLRGTLSFAHGDKPGDGGQADFFINLANNTPLDAAPGAPPNTTGFTVFAQVIAGMEVVDAIAKVQLGGTGPMGPEVAPVAPITIRRVSIQPPAK